MNANTPEHADKGHILLCDLNNFARYPTIPIGYLAALLRRAGQSVEVFSPWSLGVGGVTREAPVPIWGHLDQGLRYWSAMTPNRVVRMFRAALQRHHSNSDLNRQAALIEAAVRNRIEARPSVVLVSAYLMYFDVVRRICATCGEADIPVVVGGPYLADERVRRQWRSIPGLTALSIGESEPELVRLVESLRNGGAAGAFATFETATAPGLRRVPPFRQLDELPFPDYSDFPWSRYAHRIVPIITGRGCGWGACRFCSDITSTAGRTFRSRSVGNVLEEIEHQTSRHDATQIVFTDLKLNSNPAMWRGLIDGIPRIRADLRWIASIHIDGSGDHGLDSAAIEGAARAGMTRLTTGLESGSQRVLDLMKKGTDLAETSRVIRTAADAGISVRTTAMVGYPGERADDIAATAQYLEEHAGVIERVSLNRFTLMSGTAIDRLVSRRPEAFDDLRVLGRNDREAMVDHIGRQTSDRAYRRGLWRVLNAVHRINRRPLSDRAADFEGVM